MSLFHISKRKRSTGKALHPFPSSSLSVRFLDKAVYAAGIIAIIMMLPQLSLIYVEKNAGGIAPITWISHAILNIPWVIYGIAHKEKPIILVYILWFIVNSLVFIGAMLY